MFDELFARSNRVWVYKTGRFAEERLRFLEEMRRQGYSLHALRVINPVLLAVAERVNIWKPGLVTELQIVRAAKCWTEERSGPSSKKETRSATTKRFVYVAKNWLRFLGKWQDPDRNPQFKPELSSFLEELRDEKGYSDATCLTRETALNRFFEWLGKQGTSLTEVSPKTLADYFVQNQARGWKKGTIKIYVQSLRAFFRYASRRGWCVPGLAETIQGPRMYSMAALPEGPTWNQVQHLVASLNTGRPAHIRDRAIILLLAVYGLRIGEICNLTLDDVDWMREKIRVRRQKNKRIQDFPLTAEAGEAILKYLREVRPRCPSRSLFLTLRQPYRPIMANGISAGIALRIRAIGGSLPHYGPHSLRHTCATHLLNEGFSLKEIGDHLGHRSPRSTRIYAKVERAKLEQVPPATVSGLTEYLRTQMRPITAGWAKDRLRLLREVSNFGVGGLQ